MTYFSTNENEFLSLERFIFENLWFVQDQEDEQ